VWLAKQLGTLCHLSGERIELGVGIGGENPAEWAAAGVPKGERVGRTVELMRLLPALLSGEPVRHVGRHYDVDSPALLPAPERQPRLWMGGRAEGALRRAARLADGWLGLWVDVERLRTSNERLAECAREAGRPAPDTALVVPVLIEEDAASAEAGFARFTQLQYDSDYERFARWCIGGSVEEVAGRIVELNAAGASGFVLMSAAFDPLGELERLAEVRSILRG
jgi:alkanesulfonate monooxygenase SsuD/methylene tetrahydromethanopterin reductase-like flavin-dependent oxidoreductase (luciferase family)